MERWRGRVAVVTGASAGIGAAIAYQLQDAGLTVVALARSADKIPAAVETARKEAKERGRTSIGKAATPGKLHSLKRDVSNEESILEAFKWIKDNVKRVDILVNNAGVGGHAKLTENDTDEWRRILNTNVLGLSLCTREAIKLMREKGIDDGHIVHIGSKIGHTVMDMPGVHVYSASKHGVRVLTEGLRKELVAAKSKIRVTEVSPGAVKTEFVKNSNLSSETLALFGAKTPEELYANMSHLKSEDVADAVLYAIATPPHVQIHEIIMCAVGEVF